MEVCRTQLLQFMVYRFDPSGTVGHIVLIGIGASREVTAIRRLVRGWPLTTEATLAANNNRVLALFLCVITNRNYNGTAEEPEAIG